eukprot:TRINITY_DN885_c0_g1_i6.p2 TRINITY_DN885_c0_g1~~TRINITY_DN885_c0_g1_i6.p2  ORF type:complete len:405 (+),score=-39.18 TRINITY_DN885_c0_g1_i6:1444-2658(+)
MVVAQATDENRARIKVIGLGGGGSNAVEHMMAEAIEGVDFICANTDAQALSRCKVPVKIQLGEALTKKLGAGADPDIGRRAAEENRDKLEALFEDTDMVFLTAGMGGGTGTGSAPIVAEIAKERGILTVAVVTRPFTFEGKKRQKVAEEGIKELSQFVDSLITIPNDKLLTVLGKNITLLNAFKAANDVLLGSVQGIADLITRPGLINVDFADVRTVMSEMGMAIMGTGTSRGEHRARDAVEAAIASPLLEDIDFSGARGVLVNMTGGLDMSIGEFEIVGDAVRSFASDNATVVVGTVVDPELTDELRVTVVATGLGGRKQKEKENWGASLEETPVSTANMGAPSARGRASRPVRDERKNYRDLDRPAYLRRSNVRRDPQAIEEEREFEYLDVPAFLRRDEGER